MPVTLPSRSTTEPGNSRFGGFRGRKVLGVLGVIMATLVMSALTTACETTAPDRAAVIDSINATRSENGLPALRENTTLNVKADAWASRLRDDCRIYHSNLADGAPSEWRKLGENVGRGGSNDQIHAAYLNSPGHRANIVDSSYNQVGAGAVWGDCNGARTLFTVQVFMRG